MASRKTDIRFLWTRMDDMDGVDSMDHVGLLADMAIKYIKEKGGIESRKTEVPDKALLKRRQILFLLGAGTMAILFAALKMPAGSVTTHGEAVIVEKRDLDGKFQVKLSVLLPNGSERSAVTGIDAETFSRFEIGDRIGVLYRRGWFGGIRIIETGLVALPGPIQ